MAKEEETKKEKPKKEETMDGQEHAARKDAAYRKKVTEAAK